MAANAPVPAVLCFPDGATSLFFHGRVALRRGATSGGGGGSAAPAAILVGAQALEQHACLTPADGSRIE
jgi:hypothetical protein